MILKPSEQAPLDAHILAECFTAAGLPDGVLHVVNGPGTTLGETLVTHPLVNVVSFTGSTRVGRHVAARASAGIKRVALELGGKSANIVLDDADLEAAVRQSVRSVVTNSGQTCSALTRLLVPVHRLAQAEEIAEALVNDVHVGLRDDPQADMGPVISARQRETIRSYMHQALAEGARLVAGGPGMPDGLDRGFFVRPTIFSGVRPDATIARDEIFGPVLAILAYEDEDDAVAMANDSDYGLSGAVWSADLDRALKVATRIRTGQLSINGGPYNPLAPFGGYKQSGIGREKGRWGLEEFLETKSLQLPHQIVASVHDQRSAA